MRVLVTGATGFIGRHAVDALERAGHQVTALVRSPAKAARLDGTGARRVAGDLHDREALARATAGKDVIVHAAGLVAARNEAEFLRINRDGTSNLVRAAERGRPRLVLVSSLAAAGPSRPGGLRAEDEADRPVSAYGRSKLASECVVRESLLPWTILRPPAVYGPWDPEFLKAFRLGRRGFGAVFGRGDQELCAVYGPDLGEALVLAATETACVGRTYYPCHSDRFTSRELAERIGRTAGRTPRIVALPAWAARVLLALSGAVARLAGRTTVLSADKANELLQPAWTCDPSSFHRDTGWAAAHDLARGLPATAAWYREAGWL